MVQVQDKIHSEVLQCKALFQKDDGKYLEDEMLPMLPCSHSSLCSQGSQSHWVYPLLQFHRQFPKLFPVAIEFKRKQLNEQL